MEDLACKRRILAQKCSVGKSFDTLDRKVSSVGRVQKDAIESFSRRLQARKGLIDVRRHHSGAFGELEGDYVRLKALHSVAVGFHERSRRGTTTQGFQSDGPASGEEVEHSRMLDALPQDVKEGLPQEVGCGPRSLAPGGVQSSPPMLPCAYSHPLRPPDCQIARSPDCLIARVLGHPTRARPRRPAQRSSIADRTDAHGPSSMGASARTAIASVRAASKRLRSAVRSPR